ncbi:hypothetical protein [Spirillospora sp. NBC_01491]|uniref:hypothetical protein n=1 Tax=Spirillospora sp. NBC_01491 TaxID=2976007 RepID=UPI002E3138B1|nr:hypothetical protein [Spirillospora sp. NBC_01491]
MSGYEVAFHAKAAAEVQGLPERPYKALYDVLVNLPRDPWGHTYPDRLVDDPAYRFALFDDGDGVAHVRIDEASCRVVVHGVTWIG